MCGLQVAGMCQVTAEDIRTMKLDNRVHVAQHPMCMRVNTTRAVLTESQQGQVDFVREGLCRSFKMHVLAANSSVGDCHKRN